jgi:outer membrane protein, multidrug efflux system
MHDGEVTLSAEIANDYLDLRAAQARITLLQSELRDERQLFDLVRARAQTGFVTELDVNQQRTLLESVQAQIPELDAEERAMIHALGVLLAAPPESLKDELAAAQPIPEIPPALPPALPSDLLRRRPDIREAERKLAAATAQEGVAISDLYPKLDLIGSAAFTADTLSGLFSSRNFGTVGIGYITWPIFEAGKIRANIRSSREAGLQSYFAWRKTVLGALQDVEDALARYDDEQQHLHSLAAEENAAASSDTIARQQYANGLVTFVNVLTAETTLLSTRDQLIQSRQALARDIAALYKALGGGWDEASVNWKIRPPDPESG